MGLVRYDRLISGYHGTDAATADRLLAGAPMQPSANPFDWLGPGIYFWEHGYDRAARWAEKHRPDDPAVIGALIQLGTCYDLLDTRFTNDLARGAAEFEREMHRMGAVVPVNRGPDRGARFFDCAVITWWLDRLASRGTVYQSVRCAFTEGAPVYPGMAILRESHIQVAVRDPECIVGLFTPR